jgi:hypothetical protein
LKIPLLLVQYLYNNRKMSLPGLGIFTLDKSVVLPDEHDRTLLSMPNAVQFQNANIAAADKELITFICENTGKIRPLAISDLDSYLSLGTEMLNIGKPFYLEGIGTISKNKSGKFDFTPGEYTVFRENTPSPEQEKKKIYAKDKNQQAAPSPSQNRTGLKLFALVVALAIVGWGGWRMYKNISPAGTENNSDSPAIVQEKPPATTDTTGLSNTVHDSLKSAATDSAIPSSAGSQPSTYKFVILATTNRPRAIRRYNQLTSFDLKVHLYQKDSSFFKVYFEFPALAKDTIHIKDSLRREYAHEVIIEK